MGLCGQTIFIILRSLPFYFDAFCVNGAKVTVAQVLLFYITPPTPQPLRHDNFSFLHSGMALLYNKRFGDRAVKFKFELHYL